MTALRYFRPFVYWVLAWAVFGLLVTGWVHDQLARAALADRCGAGVVVRP